MLPHLSLRTALAGAAAVLVLVPAAAGATSVTKEDSCENEYGACSSLIVVTAAPGEANVLNIDETSDAAVLISDTGAPITSAENCERVDANTVKCFLASGSKGGPNGTTLVHGEDGDDRITFDAPGYAAGGPGADTLIAGGRGGTLYGEAGNDRLEGSEYSDDLEGGPGIDSISCGAGDDDAGAASIDGEKPGPFNQSRDVITPDCESMGLPSLGVVVPRPRVSGRHLTLRVPDEACKCKGKLVVRSSTGELIASGATKGARHRLAARLTAAGREYLDSAEPRTLVVTWTAGRERAGFTTTVGG